jgi:hypothetical protein
VSFAVDILGAVTAAKAVGRLGDTGADTEVAIAPHAGGAVSSIATSSRGAGPNTAHIVGTTPASTSTVWYTPTSFRVTATDGTVIEEYRARSRAAACSSRPSTPRTAAHRAHRQRSARLRRIGRIMRTSTTSAPSWASPTSLIETAEER